MVMVRAVLVVVTVLALALAPMLGQGLGSSADGAAAYAQDVTSPSVQHHEDFHHDNCNCNDNDGDGNDNNGGDNDNNGNDNNGGDNDNNGNDNGDGDNDNDGNGDDGDDNDNDGDDGDDNDNGGGGTAAAPAVPAPANTVSGTVASGQTGDAAKLILPSGSAVVRVSVPLPRAVTVTMTQLSASAVVSTGGTLVDGFVFSVTADGGGDFPGSVNLGIDYRPEELGGLNQQNFVIAFLEGTTFVPVQPASSVDPGNAYISATITRSGTYAVFQR